MNYELLFGRWLRKRRKALDLTQKELARRVSCSPATIRKIEAEQRRPSKALAIQLAKSLGLEEGEQQAFLGFARRGWVEGHQWTDTTDYEQLPWRPPPRIHVAASRSPDTPPSRAAHVPPPSYVDPEELSGNDGPVFVARERELASLNQHLDAALDGHGRVTFVTGDPGNGKTTLMAEFARRAQAGHPALLCATGNCNAYAGMGDPYLPFRDLMEMLCGDFDRHRWAGPANTVHAHRLRETLPNTLQALVDEGPELINVFVSSAALARRLAESAAASESVWAEVAALLERGVSATQGLAQRQLFEQYAQVLRQVAVRNPLLLLIDDLQWADGASIELLFHLARRLEGSRVLIVGAYRQNEVAEGREGSSGKGRHPLEPVVTELARHFGDNRVDLNRIPKEESRAFVDALLDTEANKLGERFRAALFRRTEGHPLFAVELLRDMQARGDLAHDEHGRWCEGPELDWRALPVRVDAVIEQRIARLDDQLRDILRVASVEGEEFSTQVVAQVQGADELRLLRDLSQKLEKRHRLVRELEITYQGLASGSRYRFTHALFQQYLYSSLSTGERRLLHAGVARALSEIHWNDLDAIAVQLAHHYGLAGDEAQELTYLHRAGVRAQRLAALEDAARFYEAALERWPQSDLEGRARIMRRLSECKWMTGRIPEALQISEESQKAFELLGDHTAIGAIERQIGRLYWEQGDRKRALQHYQKALVMLEQAPVGVELARAVSSISQMHMLASEFDEAIEWGERALELAELLGAEDVAVHALCNLGAAHSSKDDQERGIAMLWESARRAVELGLPHDAGRAYHCLCEDLVWLCRYAEARTALEEMLAYVSRVRLALFVDAARIRMAELDWLEGKWAAALAQRNELIDQWRTSQPEGHVKLLATTFLATVWNDLGRPQAAIQELEGSLGTVLRSQEQQTMVPHAGQLARAYAALGLKTEAAGPVNEVRRWVEDAKYVQPYGTVLPLLFACRWFATQEALRDAHHCLQLLERVDRQLGTLETGAALTEGRGVILLAEGVVPRAMEHFQVAVSSWEALGRPYDLLRALFGLGRVRADLGDDDEARRVLERAAEIIERLAVQLEDPELRRCFLEAMVARSQDVL